MDKCCISFSLSPRRQRRLNGFQLPLNYQQVAGWFVLIGTALLNLTVFVQMQFDELKMTALVVYTVLYLSHVLSHVIATVIDPSEKELRKLEVYNIPEFDRNIHAHVIENGRCHLCNIQTSSRCTKHCSICNKCVDHFDHHCKWLNTCIGQRNYLPFIACVTTALMISAFTSTLCLVDIILFFTSPDKLSSAGQSFINCTTIKDTPKPECKISLPLLAFLVVLFPLALGISCTLLHLCCFHVYISVLGVSTYEYVVNSETASRFTYTDSCKCRRINLSKLYISKNTNKTLSSAPENTINSKLKGNQQTTNTNRSVTNLMYLIHNELERAKKRFIFDKNKIHPQNIENMK